MMLSFRRISALACFFLLPVSLFLLGGTACTNDHSERIEKLDSLQERLKGSKKRVDKLDTAKAFDVMKRAKGELELFKTHFEKDTMGEELFNVLDAYKRTEEAFEGYRPKFKKLDEELDRSAEQLKDLKADLEEGRLSKEKAKSYIADEKKILHQLEKSVQTLEKQTKAIFENYEGRSEKLRKHLSLPDSVQWPHEGKQ